MNLKPRVSSNVLGGLDQSEVALVIKSGRESPWFWYCLATDTTKRRLARVILSRALRSPRLMAWASSTSSSIVISSSRPSPGGSGPGTGSLYLVIDFEIFSCLILLFLIVRLSLLIASPACGVGDKTAKPTWPARGSVARATVYYSYLCLRSP